MLPATAGNVERLLRELGRNAGAVVAKLAKLECFGERGSCSRCPVATYLVRRLKGVEFGDILVDAPWVRIRRRGSRLPILAETPQAVWEAIQWIDAGECPRLEVFAKS